MVAIEGLVGLRPHPEQVERVTTPPYDVIKEGSPLEARLRAEERSLYHVILGEDPAGALSRLVEESALIEDMDPAYYVYEQAFGDEIRTGVYAAVEVSDYSAHQVIRHEKTFDAKVKGRIALANDTSHTIGPVLLLTEGNLEAAFAQARAEEPLYAFESDFGGGTDLHGIKSRVWKVAAESKAGQAIAAAIAPHPLYIADGHHRYHAALRNGQTHLLAYVTGEAKILAYNRVVNGVVPFKDIASKLELTEAQEFATPARHSFCLYTKDGCWTMAAKDIPEDVVGKLDCSLLERDLYPKLKLSHDQIIDPKHFDYYPESALEDMKAVVDSGQYELAIALHPVQIADLMSVADAGLEDSDVVMPEKSTFFAPKILSGLFLYRHRKG